MSEDQEGKSVEVFKPRDARFHLFVAAMCISLAFFGAGVLAPKAIGYVLVAAAGGMNIGVVIESRRWEGRHEANAEKRSD